MSKFIESLAARLGDVSKVTVKAPSGQLVELDTSLSPAQPWDETHVVYAVSATAYVNIYHSRKPTLERTGKLIEQEYAHVREQAAEMLVEELFGEFRPKLHQIRKAIHQLDMEAALLALEALHEQMYKLPEKL